MKAEYVYCSSCGYEEFDVEVAYVRSTVDNDWYECPNCHKETSYVEWDDE